MSRKRRLTVLTCLAVFVTTLLIGGLLAPWLLLPAAEDRYIELQLDVNRRQAVSMAKFVRSRLRQGLDRQAVVDEFQRVIEGTNYQLGYLCLVEQPSQLYLCHPHRQQISMPAAKEGFVYEDAESGDTMSFAERLAGQNGRVRPGGGLLRRPEGRSEIVFSAPVSPDVPWVVSAHENLDRLEAELANLRLSLIIGAMMMGLVVSGASALVARRIGSGYETEIETKHQRLTQEQERSESLLLNILPAPIADRMKQSPEMIAERFDRVTVLFADLVGFTRMSAEAPPETVVSMLNDVFSRFDELTQERGLEKIKTVGDAYMVVGGLPEPRSDHAQAVADLALEMLRVIGQLPPLPGEDQPLQLRIGLCSGPVVAGVIGRRKFAYDLWGDVVNTASRMEMSGEPGRVHCAPSTVELLQGEYDFEQRGVVEVRGKGHMQTAFLIGRKAATNVPSQESA